MRRIEVPEAFRKPYEKWCDFIENNMAFNLQLSVWHTREHEARVLLFALLIAEKIGLSEEETEILCSAASFHDTRREDD